MIGVAPLSIFCRARGRRRRCGCSAPARMAVPHGMRAAPAVLALRPVVPLFLFLAARQTARHAMSGR